MEISMNVFPIVIHTSHVCMYLHTQECLDCINKSFKDIKGSWTQLECCVSATRNMASNNTSELAEFASSFEVNSYLALNSCLLVFLALPGLILNGLVAVALAGEVAKKQGRAQWIILLNISLAGIVTALTLGALSACRLLLYNNVNEDAEWLCRVSQATFHISIAIRTVSLALLSVVVYIIIKHGLSKVKLPPLIAAVVILWVVVVITSLPYLTPAYQYEAFRKGILICDTMLTGIAYAQIGLSILFIDIPGRLISIIAIIAAVVHVRRNTVTDFSPIKRSLLRFSVILLCINILILFANIVAALAFLVPTSSAVAVLIWLSLTVNIAIVLPTVVVPVLMMVLFKPIWSAVKGILVCQRCRGHASGEVSIGRTTASKEEPFTASTGENIGP